jgi:hypothetical protein
MNTPRGVGILYAFRKRSYPFAGQADGAYFSKKVSKFFTILTFGELGVVP